MQQPFRPAHSLAKAAIVFMIVMVVFSVLVCVSELTIGFVYPNYYDMNSPLAPGEQAVTIATIVIAGLFVLAYIPTVVVYCMWQYRVSKNARALGAKGMKISAGWGVGYFFIPILNLFRPYQAVREIEKASSPYHASNDWHRAPTISAVGWWWGLWVGSNVLNQISSQMGSSFDPATAHGSSWVGAIASLVSIGAAIQLIQVIKHITALQDEKFLTQADAMQRTCLHCGYDIRGTPGLDCPECGAPIPGREGYDDEHQAPDPAEHRPAWAED